MKNTHWRKADKTDFLGACDLDEGKDLTLNIAKVEIKEAKVRGVKGLFRIATFKENVKPMILNVGNAKIIKSFAKNDPFIENWANIPITLYVIDNAKLGSETVEALRIRPMQPKLNKKKLTPEMPREWQNCVKALSEGKLMSDIEVFYEIEEKFKDKLKDESI